MWKWGGRIPPHFVNISADANMEGDRVISEGFHARASHQEIIKATYRAGIDKNFIIAS